MKKISVLMPTYNDCNTISESLDSLFSQTYTNWNLIIIDDGSTDDTKKVIENYKNKYDKLNRIKYIYQQNQDQLKAIINGLEYVDGDYVYMLHSDDLLNEETTFEKAVDYLTLHPDYDGIYGDITIIDKDSNVTGIQKVLPYTKKKRNPAIQLLWLGRNLYIDMAFFKTDVFKTDVYYNYLVWDRPYWLNTEKSLSMLNMKKVDFSLFKYRVFEENYANNEVGKLCLIMGELRTATQLMAHYNIPFYKFQYFFYRVFVHLNLFSIFHPIYQKKPTKNKYNILKFIILKRYPNGYSDNLFLNSLSNFYDKKVKRCIDFDELYSNEEIYQGNGFRIFNKKLLNNDLEDFYIKFMGEMNKGFDEIIVSKENLSKAEDTVKFLCIYPFVKIRSK